MSANHTKVFLTSGSQYLNRIDPVTRLPFRVGAAVIICKKNAEAISASSVVVSNNNCPFCGDEIYQAYTNDSKPEYPSNLPWNHNALGPGESLLFSLLIGGGGGLLFSILPLPENSVKFLIQVLFICSVMTISFLITKQPLGASLAVLWVNLTPFFIKDIKIGLGNIIYMLTVTCIAWLVSVSIRKVIE